MKAMLLAAGRGERLRPLTDSTPKPLLSLGAKRLIDYNLVALSRLGVTTVVINVHYHAQQFFDYLGDGSRYGLQIEYSHEKTLLDTGGGIYQALPLLGDEPFILMSADVWSAYTFPDSFMQATSDVHVVLVDNPAYHPHGDYALTEDNVLSLTGERRTYANIAKIHPRVFAEFKSGVFPLSAVFNRVIERGVATGEYYTGPWFNVGTVVELEQLECFLKA